MSDREDDVMLELRSDRDDLSPKKLTQSELDRQLNALREEFDRKLREALKAKKNVLLHEDLKIRYIKIAITVAFVIIVFIGCYFQCKGVIDIYFDHKMSIDVDYKKNEGYDLPGMSVCILAQDTVSKEAIKRNYRPEATPDEIDKIYNEMKENIENMDKDTVLKVTADVGEFVFECNVTTPTNGKFAGNGSNTVPCRDVAAIVVSLQDDSKCYSFFKQEIGDEPWKLLEPTSDSQTMTLTILSSYTGKVNAFDVHGSRDQPMTSDKETLFNPEINMISAVSFSYTEVNLLEPPFDDKCRHYDKDGFTSKMDCKYKCQGNGESSWENKTAVRPCNDKCEENECHQQRYSTSLDSVVPNPADGSSVHAITVFPYRTTLTYTQEAKYQTVEFVCYIVSALSFWLGFTFLTLYQFVVSDKFIRKVCVR